jgi:hypothetical protein
MALNENDTELLEAHWDKATQLIASRLPNITPSHVGNDLRPERLAQLSGMPQDEVDKVLSDVVKQLKEEKKARENDKDRPVELIAVDNAKEAQAKADKVEQERIKKARDEELKARTERLKTGTANEHERNAAAADTMAAAHTK